MSTSDTISTPVAPHGVTAEAVGDHLLITHRSSRTSGIVVFLAVWLTIWTIGCGFAIRKIVVTSILANPVLSALVLLFVALDFLGAYVFIRILFERTEFDCTPDELIVRNHLFRWSTSRRIRKEVITSFAAVQDGGRGRDSFPTLGLQVETPNPIDLLSRQPPETIRWLGECLSRWATKPFRSMKNPERTLE